MTALQDPIRIGHWEFSWGSYDRQNDVLYLSIDEPRPGVGRQTPEGHLLRFDDHGDLSGVTLFGVRDAIDRGETIRVTGLPERLPTGAEVHARDLELVLA